MLNSDTANINDFVLLVANYAIVVNKQQTIKNGKLNNKPTITFGTNDVVTVSDPASFAKLTGHNEIVLYVSSLAMKAGLAQASHDLQQLIYQDMLTDPRNDITSTIKLTNKHGDALHYEIRNGVIVLPAGTQEVYIATQVLDSTSNVLYESDINTLGAVKLANALGDDSRKLDVSKLHTLRAFYLIDYPKTKKLMVISFAGNSKNWPMPAGTVRRGYFFITVLDK